MLSRVLPLRYLAALCVILVMQACGKDEEVLPAFEQHLCSLITTADGYTERLLLDNGSHYAVANRIATPATSIDTLRVLAYYVREADGRVRLGRTQIVPTLVPLPVHTAPLAPMLADTATLRVGSLWRSSHYVNARIEALTHNEQQTFSLYLRHIERSADGTQTAVMQLYRTPTGALPAFTSTFYLSFDVRPLAPFLRAGHDSIAIVLRTAHTPRPDSVRYTFVY